MTSNLKTICLAFACLTVSAAISCKRNDNGNPTCRITTVNSTSASGDYDNQKRLYYTGDQLASTIDSNRSGTTLRTFVRTGNTITITGGDATKAVLNSSGLVDTAFARGAVLEYFLYNSAGKLATIISPGQDTVHYAFTNGDATSASVGSIANTYTYTDKKSTAADPFKLSQFTSVGAYYLVNEHLLKSSVNSMGTMVNYSYEFDAAGRISKATQISNGMAFPDTLRNSYQYTCQ